MLTLTEASKLIQNPLQRGVVEIFPRSSAVLERLPFMDVAGNAYAWNQEQTLPGIGFRGYNDTYTESTGVINPMTEALKIFGGISSFFANQSTSDVEMGNAKLLSTQADAAATDVGLVTTKGAYDQARVARAERATSSALAVEVRTMPRPTLGWPLLR